MTNIEDQHDNAWWKMSDAKLINFFARYANAKCGIDLDEIRQELRIEAWLARQEYDPEASINGKFNTFLVQRLYWKTLNLIRWDVRRRRLTEILQVNYADDFAAPPSPTFCCLAYELELRLTSVEARKVLTVLQTPSHLVVPDTKRKPCISARSIASYLGIAELSVKRGLREIKREIRELLGDSDRYWTFGHPTRLWNFDGET